MVWRWSWKLKLLCMCDQICCGNCKTKVSFCHLLISRIQQEHVSHPVHLLLFFTSLDFQFFGLIFCWLLWLFWLGDKTEHPTSAVPGSLWDLFYPELIPEKYISSSNSSGLVTQWSSTFLYYKGQNPLHQFPCNFPVTNVTGKLPTCYKLATEYTVLQTSCKLVSDTANYLDMSR